jgi:hypothetical protein
MCPWVLLLLMLVLWSVQCPAVLLLLLQQAAAAA